MGSRCNKGWCIEMMIFSKALLGISAKKVYEPIIARLSVVRVNITKPENYSSPDSDYSVIEASATSTSGSRYVYVYPKDEYKELFAEGVEEGNRTIEVRCSESELAIVQYGTSTSRFAIGNITNVASGTFHLYIYNTKTQKNIYEFDVIWTNNI